MSNPGKHSNPSSPRSTRRKTPKFPSVPGSTGIVFKDYRGTNKAGLGVEILAVANKAGARTVRFEADEIERNEAEITIGLTGEPRQIRATDVTIQRLFEHRTTAAVDPDRDSAAPAATHHTTVRTIGISMTIELLSLVASYISLKRLEVADLSDGEADVAVYEVNAWLCAGSRVAHANFSAALDGFLLRHKAAGALTPIHDDWTDPGTLGFGDGPDAPPLGPPPVINGAHASVLAATRRSPLPHPDNRRADEPSQNCDIN